MVLEVPDLSNVVDNLYFLPLFAAKISESCAWQVIVNVAAAESRLLCAYCDFVAFSFSFSSSLSAASQTPRQHVRVSVGVDQ